MKLNENGYWADFTDDKAAVQEFKKVASAYLGCQHVIPVSNGTHAIEIALRSGALQKGDAVIVPDISFIASATALANAGLVPVYADVDPGYFGLSLESLERRYSERVKAVLVVHFAGVVCRDIAGIKAFCLQHRLLLIEDCAQAFSGSADGAKVGTIGDLGTCSFQSSKIINSGEGGMISTNTDQLGAICEAIADWGMSPAFPTRQFHIASSNFRLSGLQCYHLSRQIRDIDAIVAKRLHRYQELELACQKLGLESAFPKPMPGFVDCPFFFVVKTTRQNHMIEPRDESPMHRSSIVKSILKRFFPDLLSLYEDLNPVALTSQFASLAVVSQHNFINISGTAHVDAEELLSVYC